MAFGALGALQGGGTSMRTRSIVVAGPLLFAGTVALISATTIYAQEAPTQAPAPSKRVQRTQQDYVDTYLQKKQREFQASERAVQARNLSAHSTAIYNLLREKGPFGRSSVIGRDAAQQQQVREALTRTVAYFLTAVGMTPDEINRLQRSGLDPLQAGANIIASTATIEDALTVSPIAVIAEVATK